MARRLSPEQRSMHARLAAHSLHAQVEDPSAHTAPARAAFMARFERQVDPDGKLSPQERARRAEHARKAYFLALSLKAAKKRSRKVVEGVGSDLPLAGRGTATGPASSASSGVELEREGRAA